MVQQFGGCSTEIIITSRWGTIEKMATAYVRAMQASSYRKVKLSPFRPWPPVRIGAVRCQVLMAGIRISTPKSEAMVISWKLQGTTTTTLVLYIERSHLRWFKSLKRMPPQDIWGKVGRGRSGFPGLCCCPHSKVRITCKKWMDGFILPTFTIEICVNMQLLMSLC